jgi:excisionase family DNA binding protein
MDSVSGDTYAKIGDDMQQITPLPDLLTVHDVADYLRVPVGWVYERTRKGGIPTRKVGRHVRIPKAEFLVWLERLEVVA